jgi:hypothetical protein
MKKQFIKDLPIYLNGFAIGWIFWRLPKYEIMEQKFLITDNQYDVQLLLDAGWKIVSVTAQVVSTGKDYSSEKGKFAIVLERPL